MNTYYLDINDADFSLDSAGDRAARAMGPGCALVDHAQIQYGSAATAQARLQPRQIQNTFWHQLDRTPLKPPFPVHLTAADLVHGHLQQLLPRLSESERRLTLAVPGSLGTDRLGLLLGIVQALGWQIEGMVDSGLAACSAGLDLVLAKRSRLPASLLFLDIQLHQALLTECRLIRSPDPQGSPEANLMRTRVIREPRVGRAQLEQLWAHQIAAVSVRTNRFDPLHHATSEQALFNRLPSLLEELDHQSPASVDILFEGRAFSIQIHREELAEATQSAHAALVDLVREAAGNQADAALLLSHRAGEVPGLVSSLNGLVGAPTVLSRSTPLFGAMKATTRRQPNGHAQLLTKTLVALPDGSHGPHLAAPVATAPTERPNGEERYPNETGRGRPTDQTPSPNHPSHVLYRGQAYRIEAPRFALGSDLPEETRGMNLKRPDLGIQPEHCHLIRDRDGLWVEPFNAAPCFLNRRIVRRRTRLLAGDQLRLGEPGEAVQLIAVVS